MYLFVDYFYVSKQNIPDGTQRLVKSYLGLHKI